MVSGATHAVAARQQVRSHLSVLNQVVGEYESGDEHDCLEGLEVELWETRLVVEGISHRDVAERLTVRGCPMIQPTMTRTGMTPILWSRFDQ